MNDTQILKREKEFLIVGIGASAGGVKALKEFFERVPIDSGIAYVVILHLSPKHESLLAEILQTSVSIPVTQVRDRKVQVVPNHVYVIPPNKTLTISNGHLALSEVTCAEERRAPIDIFFRTLAEMHHSNAVAVILSGTSSDGSLGVKRIKEKGGIILVQEPNEAEYDDMPRNSLATGLVDFVLPASEMPAKIAAYNAQHWKVKVRRKQKARPENIEQALLNIFKQLKIHTGHDFTNYKRTTVLRRIERRIVVNGLENIHEYSRFIVEKPEEAATLLKDLLISVTNFFRDPEIFAALEHTIIKRLFENKTEKESIRVWVAGCATGEEAYSLGMLLTERAESLPDAPSIQIFATDIDEAAIAAARSGFYTTAEVADVSPERLRRFFVKESGGFRVRHELREKVLFAVHNLLKEPPFSHLDLVSCRNLMIYLNKTAQKQVVETFYLALNGGGFIFLGTSETVNNTGELFVTFDGEHQVYQARNVVTQISPPVALLANISTKPSENERTDDVDALERLAYSELHQQLLEIYAPPSVVVNANYDILHLSKRAGRYLELAGGEPSLNLLKIVRPELRMELRTAFYQALQSRADVEKRISISIEKSLREINLIVRPILRHGEAARGFFLVLFEELDGAQQNREGAAMKTTGLTETSLPSTELERVRAQLRSTIEQFETEHEELRASNEELSSSAEELETSKEELQSMNEELTTVNQELKIKIEELCQSNDDFHNLMAATDIGTIFLDRVLRIKFYTPPALKVFNVIAADIGRSLEHITHRLDYENLAEDALEVMKTLRTVEREARSGDGECFVVRLVPYRTTDERVDGVVLTFVDFTERKNVEVQLAAVNAAHQQNEEKLRVSEELLQGLIDALTAHIAVLDEDNLIVKVNKNWRNYAEENLFQGNDSGIGQNYLNACVSSEDAETQEGREATEGIKRVASGELEMFELEYPCHSPNEEQWFVLRVTRFNVSKDALRIVVAHENITERKLNEIELIKLNSEIKKQARTFDTTLSSITDFAYTFDRDGRFTFANRPLLDLWGISLENAVGKNFYELNYPADLAAELQHQVQKVIDTKQTVKGETPYTSPTGYKGFYEFIFNPVFADDGTLELVAGSTRDTTTRKRLETNFAFAAEISRDLTTLSGIDEIMQNVGAKIGAYLDLSNCALIEVDETRDAAVINHAWNRPNAVELRGVHHLSEYLSDEFKKAGRAGQNFIVNDTRNDARIDVAACVKFKIGAMLGVPVIENDKWEFMMLVYHDAPHFWQADEIELINDLTKRIRMRLERARSDQALRESEEKYRQLFNSIDEGFAIVEMIFDADDKPVNYRFLETNPAFEKQTGLIRVIGKTSLEIMPNLENFWFEIFGKVALTGESVRFESETALVNRTFDIFASRVGDNNESRKVAIVFNDITELKQHEKDQRQLLRKLVTTQEDERRSISRELHDHFGQNLTALQINLESLRKGPTGADNLREKIEQIQKIAAQLDAKVDFLARELRPTVLDDLGLATALDNFTNEWSLHSGIPVKFHTAGLETTRLSPEVEINLYRIVQEALNNVSKYAAAARANVILERRDGHISLIIEDNGSGFNLKAKTHGKRKGLGIVGMRERAALVGGTLEVESKMKKGTTVFVRIPLEATKD